MYNGCNLLITVYSVRTMRLDAIENKYKKNKWTRKQERSDSGRRKKTGRQIDRKEEETFSSFKSFSLC